MRITKFLFMASTLLLLAAVGYAAEESTIFITYSNQASIDEGDDDFRQAVFFSVPNTVIDTLYLRIFDADLGGQNDAQYGVFDSKTRFRFYGGTGAFTSPSLQHPYPTITDLYAGNLINEETIGEDEFRDHKWYTFAKVAPNQGEAVDGRYVFKLVIEGLDGNDGNVFQVAFSQKSKRNLEPRDLKVFSYGPTIRLPYSGVHAELRFFVPKDVNNISVHNFDLAAANISISTKFRDGLTVTPSPQGQWAQNEASFEDNETNQDVAIIFEGGYEIPNDASFYVLNTETNKALPFSLPIKTLRMNTRPVPRVKLTPVSDCNTIVLDGTGSYDADGHEIKYHWNFGDGRTGEGSRVVHQYSGAGTFKGELIVTDQSDHIGNSSLKTFEVFVNEPPIADAGADIVTIPAEILTFDASNSVDRDGKITRYIWNFGDGSRTEGKQVTHAYNKPGNYKVSLRVEDDSDSPCNFDTDDMEVWVNAPPVVEIGEDHIISPNEPITLSGSHSYDSDGEIATYFWDFGDGTNERKMIVTHQYDKPGRYRVKLTIVDDTDVENNMASDAITIVVNDPPDAFVESDIQVIAAGEPVSFSGAKSVDRDGKLIEYQWNYGDGHHGDGVKTKHAYDRPGVYRVNLTVRDNSTTSSDLAQAEMDIIVNHPPVADAGVDQLVTSSIVEFNGLRSSDLDGEIIDYTWDFGDGSKGNGPTPVHVYGNPGTYDITLTVTDDSKTSSSKDSDQMQVIVNSTPIADAGQELIGAPGENLTFDGSMSIDPDGEIKDFVWQFGDGQSARGDVVYHSYQRPGTYTAILTVKDNTSHQAAVSYDGVKVFINTPPVAVAGADIIAAPGDKISFDGQHSYDTDGEISSYQWDFSDGQETANKSKTSRTFESPGIYTATLTVVDDSDARNAQSQDQLVVRINHQPVANLGNDQLTCDLAVKFNGSASVDADGDPLTYSWDFGDGTPAFTGVRLQHTYDEPGIYPVILTVDDGKGLSNSKHSSSVVVTINQAPIANAGEDRTICAGDIVLFSGASSYDPEGGLLRFNWDFGDGTTDVGINPTKKYTKGGVYRVLLRVTDDSGLPCNQDVDQIVVRVAESPVASAGEDQTVCANSEVKFDGQNSTDFDGLVNRFFWDFGDGTTMDGPTPTHVFRDPGEYIVTLTITGDLVGECDNSDSDELVVTVYDAPVAKFNAPDAMPVGADVELDASESTGGGADIVDYEWNLGDGNIKQGKMVEHVYDKPGKYFITLDIRTDSDTECNTTSTRDLIIINDTPIAEAGADQLVGVNQVVVFDAGGSSDSDGSLSQYLWDFGDGDSSEGFQARHKYKEPGRYEVILTIKDDTDLANNTAVDKLYVTVNDKPIPKITIPEWACAGAPVNFSGQGSSDPDGSVTSYFWQFGDGHTGEGLTTTHAYKSPGKYNVTLAVKDDRDVSNSTDETTATININHPPVVIPGSDILGSPDEILDFNGSDSYDLDGEITYYSWMFGDGGRSEGVKTSHAFARPGNYTVTLTATDNSGVTCGTASANLQVRINAPPVANAGLDREAFVGGAHDAVMFDGTASNDPDGDPLTYKWNFGDGSSGNGPIVSHAYKKEGTYKVTLVVNDNTGTESSTSLHTITVTVKRHE